MIDIFRRFFARVTPFQRWCGVGGALLVALGAALLVTMTANGDAGGGGNGSPPQSPGSIFASRSPGARLAGALHQIKQKLSAVSHRRSRPNATWPTERVLSVVRTRPVGPLMLAPNTGPYTGLGLLAPPATMMPASTGAISYVSSPAFDVPGFSFGDVPLVQNGGPSQPGNPPPGPPTPGSPVPEVATWMMMVAGLGLAGVALRRQTVASAPA